MAIGNLLFHASDIKPHDTQRSGDRIGLDHSRLELLDQLVNEVLSQTIDTVQFDPAQTDQSHKRHLSDEILLLLTKQLDLKQLHLSLTEKQQIISAVLDEIYGYGPITKLLEDPNISEVMVNGPKQVYVEIAGKIHLSEKRFRDDRHIYHIIEKIIAPLGRHVDESSPMVDGRLPDGSRVNVIIPPLSIKGPAITIRKFSKDPFTLEDLISFGTLNQDMARFLQGCVRGRINVIISGGTGSGKTTFLNVLSGFIPNEERIVTVEDAAELQLQQQHVVTLESRPANIEGRGAVTIRDLVVNSLRMRPDRIVVGEVRSSEALDMLQAMNTGHDGSLTTIHANSTRDSLSRLETMVMMAGMELPSRAIREQIASAIHVVVQVSRFPDGTRKLSKISEITGMEGDSITMQDIFEYQQFGMDETGHLIGRHIPTGIVPSFIDKLKNKGEIIPNTIFKPDQRTP